MRYYVLSDVHGFFDIADRALTESGYYGYYGEKKLVILGDLLDRGKQPCEVIEWVKNFVERDRVILIRGNHEDLIVELAENVELYTAMGLHYSHHAVNGTVRTLSEITDMSKTYMEFYPDATRDRFYRSDFYKYVLPAMVDYYETDRYVFTHGWVPCLAANEKTGVYVLDPDWRDADKKAWEEARWISGQRAAHAGALVEGKTVVCGHESASYGHARYENKGSEMGKDADYTPYYAPGVIAIDARTAYSGKVNVLVLDD